MNVAEIQAFGFVWYRFEDYDAIKRIMSDGSQLPTTFAVWRMKAESKEKQFRREGKVVVRAFIDPKTFPDWCASRGLNLDAKARNLFASIVAKDRIAGSHGEPNGIQ